MYFRVLRSVSTILKNKKLHQNAAFVPPSLTLIVEKLSPFVNNCVNHFSSEPSDADIMKQLRSPKDPVGRKNKIDEDAQKEIDEMIANNPEIEKYQKILALEISVWKEDGELVPSEVKPRHWLELLKLKSTSKRKRYLSYLFKNEQSNLNLKKYKLERSLVLEQVREERKNAVDSGEIVYGIGHNFMLRRIVDPTMNQLWTWNSLKAIMYGNKIVFDFNYEQYMTPIELSSCAKQIMESYALNRVHDFPFEIFLCNVNFSGKLIEKVHRFIPTLFDDDFPWTISSKSYLELFEKPKLVYLSANAPNMLEKYDPESVYIIGAYVDKGNSQPISLGIAKKEKLRMAKLPLDKYLHFGDGSGKDLTLNQVCGVLLDSQCKDWPKALEHIPRRKLFDSRLRSMERRVFNASLGKRDPSDYDDEEVGMKPRFYDASSDKRDNAGYDGKVGMKPRFYDASFNKKDKADYDEEVETKTKFQSAGVNDFSHIARAKLRQQWNK